MLKSVTERISNRVVENAIFKKAQYFTKWHDVLLRRHELVLSNSMLGGGSHFGKTQCCTKDWCFIQKAGCFIQKGKIKLVIVATS